MARISSEETDTIISSFEKLCVEAETLALQWDCIDLKNLRGSLDAEAEKIAEELETRRNSRKILALMAKNFKIAQQNGPILMEQTDELIKSFKDEVDATTRRAKFAEGVFLNVYRILREESLSDPAIVLRKCSELGKSSLKQLMEKLEPSAKLEKQTDVLVSRLSEIGLLSLNASNSKLSSGEIIDQLFKNEKELIQKECMSKEIQKWKTEKLILLRNSDEKYIKFQEKSDLKILSLENEIQNLENELNFEKVAIHTRKEEEKRCSIIMNENKDLKNHISEMKRNLNDNKHKFEILENHHKKELEQLINSINSANILLEEFQFKEKNKLEIIDNLEKEKKRLEFKILNELKKIKENLQSMEVQENEKNFIIEEGRDVENGVDLTHEDMNNDIEAESLSIMNEILNLKVKLREAQDHNVLLIAQCQQASSEREHFTNSMEEKADLIKKLQGDLRDAHQVVETGKIMLQAHIKAQPPRSSSSGIGSSFKNALPSFSTFSPLKTPNFSLDPSASSASNVTTMVELDVEDLLESSSGDGGGGYSASDRMLQAVRGQRDRFRREVNRREGELAIAKNISEQLSENAKQLRSENLTLFKKVRYLTNGGGGRNHSDIENANLSTIESKYAEMYDTSMDPFTLWETNERFEASKKLCLFDQFLLYILDFLLPSTPRRWCFIFYLIFIHVAVFSVCGSTATTTPLLTQTVLQT